MHIRKRANVGENPASSHAWEEAPIQAAFSKPGNSEVVTHMCMYNKRRPDNGTLVRKSARLRGLDKSLKPVIVGVITHATTVQ